MELKHRACFYSIDITELLDGLSKKDFSTGIISRQLLGSATSIGANIIEAQAGSSKKDFTNFFASLLSPPMKQNFG